MLALGINSPVNPEKTESIYRKMLIFLAFVLVLLMLSLVYFAQRNLWTNLEPAASKRKNGPAKAAAASFSGKKAEDKESKKEREERLEKEKESEENASFYRERAGDLYAERAAVGRWLRMDTPFRAQSADEKFRYVIHILCVILLAGGYLFYHQR